MFISSLIQVVSLDRRRKFRLPGVYKSYLCTKGCNSGAESASASQIRFQMFNIFETASIRLPSSSNFLSTVHPAYCVNQYQKRCWANCGICCISTVAPPVLTGWSGSNAKVLCVLLWKWSNKFSMQAYNLPLFRAYHNKCVCLRTCVLPKV